MFMENFRCFVDGCGKVAFICPGHSLFLALDFLEGSGLHFFIKLFVGHGEQYFYQFFEVVLFTGTNIFLAGLRESVYEKGAGALAEADKGTISSGFSLSGPRQPGGDMAGYAGYSIRMK
jgi:hypothetical protein